MDCESINQYNGQKVKITLSNGFWYRAKITSVSSITNTVTFFEERGKKITCSPDAIIIIEELKNDRNN